MKQPTLTDSNSKNSSLQYHQALEEKGYLEKEGSGTYRFSSAVDAWPGSDEVGTSIPVLGRNHGRNHAVSGRSRFRRDNIQSTFPKCQGRVSPPVKGTSMKELEISDVDYVLLSKTEVRNGDVRAVLYKGETTLKKVQKEKSQIRLKPANPEFDDIIIEPDEAEVGQILGNTLTIPAGAV